MSLLLLFAGSHAAYTVAADAGSYALTGTAATPKHAWKLSAGAGSYALTGAAATPKAARKVAAGAGSYAITGTVASPKLGKKIAAGVGSYALTGTAATLKPGRRIAAGAGAFLFSGSSLSGASFFGVNFSGTEFPPSITAKYGFPQTSDLQYLFDRGIREEIRIPISHERLEPVLGAGFDTTYLNLIKSLCVAAHSFGCSVTIDLHNFGRFSGASWTSNGYPGQSGDILGGSVYTQAALVNTWEDLVTELDGYPAVVAYDIMNEPHDLVGINSFRQPNYIGGDAWFPTNSASAVQQAEGSNPVAGYGPSWIIHAGANYASYLQPVVLTAVPWVIHCKARCASGTKAGRLYIGAANGTFTASTTWALKQFTVTPSAGSNDCGVTVDNIGDDIEIANLQIQPGTVAGTYVPNRWQPIAQAVVTAMRALTSKRIIVAGDNYSSAFNWKRDNYELIITGDNVEYGAHQYFDSNGSGAYALSYAAEGAAPSLGATRVAPFIAWCATKGVVGRLNEFGVPLNDLDWLEVLRSALDACRAGGIRGSEWFYGATSSQDPGDLNMASAANGGVDAPQIALLTEAVGGLFHDRLLSAGAGACALTGTAATPRRNLPLAAGAGSYALAGVAATLKAGRKTAAAPGAFAFTGASAALIHSWRIAAGTGSFALTGAAAAPRRSLPLVAAAGSYALTGTSAGLLHSRKISGSAGSFALTGYAATARHTWRVEAAAGSYAQVGTDADLTFESAAAFVLAAGNGSFALSGSPAGELHAWRLTLGAGSFALAGASAALRTSRRLAGGAGAFALSGAGVSLITSAKVVAEAGAYVISGPGSDLLIARKVIATSGAVDLSGTGANSHRTRRLPASAGLFSLAGASVVLSYGWRVSVDAGAFALSGADVALPKTRRLVAGPGIFTLAGTDVTLTARHLAITERVFAVAAEVRTFVADGEDHAVAAHAEDRSVAVGGGGDVIVGAEDRSLTAN